MRDSVSRCSASLHTARHRLAERNRYVTLRSLFMSGLDAPVSPCLQFRLRRFTPSLPSPSVSSSLPAPTCSASTSGSDCPPPARLTRAKVSATVLLFDCMCKLPYTVLPRFSRIKTVACRGLRPCPLCHLCPATATAVAVAASGPKQHRPSDERPLRPQCEVQRHHPREGNCRIYIFIYSLGVVDNCIWKVYSNGDSEYQIFPSIIHRYSLIITCLCQNYLLNSPIISEILKD